MHPLEGLGRLPGHAAVHLRRAGGRACGRAGVRTCRHRQRCLLAPMLMLLARATKPLPPPSPRPASPTRCICRPGSTPGCLPATACAGLPASHGSKQAHRQLHVVHRGAAARVRVHHALARHGAGPALRVAGRGEAGWERGRRVQAWAGGRAGPQQGRGRQANGSRQPPPARRAPTHPPTLMVTMPLSNLPSLFSCATVASSVACSGGGAGAGAGQLGG